MDSLLAATIDLDSSLIRDAIISGIGGYLIFIIKQNSVRDQEWRNKVDDRLITLEKDIVQVKTKLELTE